MKKKVESLLSLEGVVDPQTISKGLSKLNPTLRRFFNGINKAGLGIGAGISFLRSQLMGQNVQPESGEAPFETAGRELKRQRDIPKSALKSVGNVGMSALAGGLGGKVLGAGAGIAGSLLGRGGDQPQPDQPQPDQPQPEQPQDYTDEVIVDPNQTQSEPQQIQQSQPQPPQQPQQPQQPQEMSLLDTLRNIDKVLAGEIETMIGQNLSPSQIETGLKTSKQFLQRTLNAERKLRSPISRIIEGIMGGQQQQMQPQQGKGDEKYQNILTSFMDRRNNAS